MKKALILVLSLMMVAVFAVSCTAKDTPEVTAAPTVEAATDATDEPAVTAEATEDVPAETEGDTGDTADETTEG